MRYTTSQWRAFAVLVVANALAILLLVGIAEVGTAFLVVYAIVVPVLFRLVVVASSELQPHTAAQAISVWRAMRRGEITLYFQPKVSLTDGQVFGAEALARWEHPKRGVLAPAEWIAATEQFRWLERRFARYTLNAACRQAWAWRGAGKDLQVCVNLSPCAFAEDSLVDDVQRLLAEWKIPPTAIEIEVTEHALQFSDDTERVSQELARMGVALALDDFGTGHSSMARLVRLPFGALKIDRSFVTDMLTDHRRLAVVTSTCNLAHSLNLSIIAEGVETVDVLEALHLAGCDIAQGYLFSRPLPVEQFNVWLEDHESDPLVPAGHAPDRRVQIRREGDREP